LGPPKPTSFTLVELLTVMAIISILTAIVLFAASGVRNKTARSRAASEIQTISSALESYKTDNGIYPSFTGFTTNTTYSANDGSQSGGLYKQSSQILYQALSGQTNATDTPIGNKSYMAFSQGIIGDATTGTGSYLRDPWGYSYGYSSTNAYTTFFDLWSTGGLLKGNANFTNAWIANWK
jgi:prepilin-type N-terminal cleavage/methylation domain-containing protein